MTVNDKELKRRPGMGEQLPSLWAFTHPRFARPTLPSAMKEPITYRPATSLDADRLAALHARSWQETYRGILPDSFLNDEVETERLAYWREQLSINLPNRQIIIAESGSILAGFACTLAEDDPVYGALLDNLHIAAAYKGRGVGRQLMKQAAVWVQEQQPDSSFYLWVYEQNEAARAFYERLGAINHEAIQGEYARVLRYIWPNVRTLIAANTYTV